MTSSSFSSGRKEIISSYSEDWNLRCRDSLWGDISDRGELGNEMSGREDISAVDFIALDSASIFNQYI